MHINFPEGLRPAILVLALVGISAMAGAQDTSAAMRDSGIRDTSGRNVGVLRSGDVVRIVVFREKDLTG